jgi:hypothetical protein
MDCGEEMTVPPGVDRAKVFEWLERHPAREEKPS